MADSSASFCLACFARIPDDAETCPHCKASISDLRGQCYAVKLLHALEHPLADVRMRAIIALGLRGEAGAARALVACALRQPTDVVEGLQIVDSLRRIQAADPTASGLAELAARHPARAVRNAARSALAPIVSARAGAPDTT